MSDQTNKIVEMFNNLLGVQEEATKKALDLSNGLRMRIITGSNTPVNMDELVSLLATLADTQKQIQNLVLADLHGLLKTMDQVVNEVTMEKLVIRNLVTLLDKKGILPKVEFESEWNETVKLANEEIEAMQKESH
jgi:hypothetical protein